MFLTARTGVETRLLITKAVTTLPLPLGAIAARALALLSKTAVIARLPILALAVGIGAAVKIPILSLWPFDRALIGVCIEGGTLEIRLRLGAIAHLAAILLRLRDRRRNLRSALQWRSKTIRQGDEIIIVVAFVQFLAIAAVLGLELRSLSCGDESKIMLGVLQ